MRHFLFLQGPHGNFFKALGYELNRLGYQVSRVNLCGGDWIDWHGKFTQCYRGQKNTWSSWISSYFDTNNVTDLLVFGDWRPMHSEAITIAKFKNIRIWVFEEGYLRPAYITMEKNGVNGRSELLKDCDDIIGYSQKLLEKNKLECGEPIKVANPLGKRMRLASRYATYEFFGKFYFFWYHTHRPTGILKELFSWAGRFLNKNKQRVDSVQTLKKVYRLKKSFFLFPLQLDSDSQVRLYSPFGGMKEAIIYVMSSFANHAFKDDILIIKNHPMDNGLINYKQFIQNFSKALGITDRVYFIETGNSRLMLKKTKGMVVLNSTIGMTALKNNIPVYCVGTSIYAQKGLAINKNQESIDEFWKNLITPDTETLKAFETILKVKALVNGGFYSEQGVSLAVPNCIKRLIE